MTLYICQFTMTGRTLVWTATDEDKALAVCAADYESLHGCSDLSEAIRYDRMDAYATDDPLDLFAWIETHRQSLFAKAWSAFYGTLRSEIEDLAEERETANEEFEHVAFDGEFVWSEDDGEWTLGNYPPEKAEGLAEAICAAYMRRLATTNLVSEDV